MPYPVKLSTITPGDVILIGPDPTRAYVVTIHADVEHVNVGYVPIPKRVRVAGNITTAAPIHYHRGNPGDIVALANDSVTTRTPPVTPTRAAVLVALYLFIASLHVYFAVAGYSDGRYIYAAATTTVTIIALALAAKFTRHITR